VTRAGLLAAGAALCAAIASVVGWQTESTTGATSPATADGRLDGARLFRSKGCASCHAPSDSSPVRGAFPSLVGAAEWAGDRRPGLTAEQYVAESIRAPSAFISPAFDGPSGGTEGMPDLGLTDEEIDALVTYVLQG
jgi:mono/diheme cytochrome c family protein